MKHSAKGNYMLRLYHGGKRVRTISCSTKAAASKFALKFKKEGYHVEIWHKPTEAANAKPVLDRII